MRTYQDVENLKRIAESYKVVSFDIFDTLLFRAVPKPGDIFIVANEMATSYGVCADAFPSARAEAESAAAKNKPVGSDTTLDMIYAELPYDQQVKEILKACELEAERRLLVANKPLISIANELQDAGKTVIVISDMYLSSDFLSSVLLQNGLKPDKLYVSSDYGMRKSRGDLFKYVINDLGLNPGDVLHIGDNSLSDGLMPLRCGVASALYRRKTGGSVSGVPSCANELVMHSLSSRACDATSVPLEQVGYAFLGPLLVGMCQWIKTEFSRRAGYSLHFLSRDGFIVHKAFSLLYPDADARYSYVSRRSLTVPFLAEAQSFADVLEIVPYIKRHETIGSLLEKIGLSDESFANVLRGRFGDDICRADMLDGSLDSLFDSIKDRMWQNALDEKESMNGYLSQEFDTDSLLVDVGWYGTIQGCLNRATGKNIFGLYLGLLRHDPDYALCNARGYAYDYIHGDSFNSSLVFSFNGLAETFFTAPHGSVKKYERREDGAFVPVLAKYEMENSGAIEAIHNGALHYVKDYASLLGGLELMPARSDYAFANMERLMSMPSKEEVDLLGDLWFYDASYDKLVCLEKPFDYLKHPKSLMRDFLRSNWKAGWLRSFFHSGGIARSVYLAMHRIRKGGKA